jgi:catechol 2,3-dioxygenase-like lactoylglutathione lyase family enzyme
MAGSTRLVTLMPIRNMNRASRFYTRVLGAGRGDRAPGAMKDVWASVTFGGADIRLIAPERREKRALASTGLLVKNIRTTVRALAKKGVRFERATRSGSQTRIEGPIAFESFGAGAFFKDTEGNLLMRWQNIPRCEGRLLLLSSRG